MKSSTLFLGPAALTLCATLVFADPTVRVTYPDGIPRVEIEGDYRQTHYTVWRAGSPGGPWAPITDAYVLCLGECFVDDYSARPGETYWYRFDFVSSDGTYTSYGPFEVRISDRLSRRISIALSPNPGRGPARVRLTLAGPPGGAPVQAEATLFDLQGRRTSTIHRGLLAPGTTTVDWDGRSDTGDALRDGIYFLRLSAADGRSVVIRVIRIR